MRITDLRGILNYVRQFRDKIFVVSFDSRIIDGDSFTNLFTDIALLRNMNIRIVLVHGAGEQIKNIGKDLNIVPSNIHGIGVTDKQTLDVAILAANRNAHKILQKLIDCDMQGAVVNAVVAHPRGVINGQDHLYTGKVERVNVPFILDLLDHDTVPVIPPIGFDGEGGVFRLNNDEVALEVATALKASKLIMLSDKINIQKGGEHVRQMTMPEVESFLEHHRNNLSPTEASKVEHALRACVNGVHRVHIVDSQDDEALMTELFTNEGVGTMIYADEYMQIRPATKRDIVSILRLLEKPILNEELIKRDRSKLANQLDHFYVYEIDKTVAGCVSISILQETPKVAEMACLCVSEKNANQGIGRKLMLFAENRARELGVKRLLALSTQAFNYIQNKGGFKEGEIDLLPQARRKFYEESGRNSKILYKDLDSSLGK
jgi:amino-acid N-acetyltransferase